MKPAAWRLVITAVLFACWIGYLGYLVAATRNPIILSRPQFLVSTLDVVATRQGDDSFLVDEVLYPANKNEEWRGKIITVSNLIKCQVYSARTGGEPVPADEGRKYLLPLDEDATANAWVLLASNSVRRVTDFLGLTAKEPATVKHVIGLAVTVVPTPPSPGYKTGPPRIYPFNAAVLNEYRIVPK